MHKDTAKGVFMAKQNFLSGGYYGKLGQTVGQRWKNIRTIRSYVIPRNPRTPEQQANRGRFGDCVFYAQLGNQLNFKATCFEVPSMSRWNVRMRTARRLQDLGMEQLDRIPLYPTDMQVPYLIDEASITHIVDGSHFEVTVNGNIPEAERVLTAILLLPGTEDWRNRLVVCVGANEAATPNVYTFRMPEEVTLEDGIMCRFVSADDVDSALDMIASSTLSLPIAGVTERDFNTEIISIERDSNSWRFTFAEKYVSGNLSISGVQLTAVVNGASQTLNYISPTLINNGGNFCLAFPFSALFEEDIPALNIASQLSIQSIEFSSPTLLLTASNVVLSVTKNDDLIRKIERTPQREAVGNYLTWSVPTNSLAVGQSVTGTAEVVDNRLMRLQTENRTFKWEVQGGKIVGFDSTYTWTPPARSGSNITTPESMEIVLEGVTYVLPQIKEGYTYSGVAVLPNTWVSNNAAQFNDGGGWFVLVDFPDGGGAPSVDRIDVTFSGRINISVNGFNTQTSIPTLDYADMDGDDFEIGIEYDLSPSPGGGITDEGTWSTTADGWCKLSDEMGNEWQIAAFSGKSCDIDF